MTERLGECGSATDPADLPGDEQRLLEGLERLSERSRYRRFLASHRRLSEAELRHFTQVDHHDHNAIVAVDPETHLTDHGHLVPVALSLCRPVLPQYFGDDLVDATSAVTRSAVAWLSPVSITARTPSSRRDATWRRNAVGQPFLLDRPSALCHCGHGTTTSRLSTSRTPGAEPTAFAATLRSWSECTRPLR